MVLVTDKQSNARKQCHAVLPSCLELVPTVITFTLVFMLEVRQQQITGAVLEQKAAYSTKRC